MDINHDYEPQFIGFHDLMKNRVREILVVSSMYDAFVLEEDGRLSEKILGEYIDLNLGFVPRTKRVSSAEEAFRAIKETSFDMIITTSRIVGMDIFNFGKKVKEIKPSMPVILLTYNTIELERLVKVKQKESIDKIFYWSGDSKLLVAIIKYVEDLLNVSDDCLSGVRVILLVEDSPIYYSSVLPVLYTEIVTQTRLLISQSVNDLHRLLRMRARPKILLAETYEEALNIYEKYKKNLIGIISDIRFPREGKIDPLAGFHLIDTVNVKTNDVPFLLQSSEPEKMYLAKEKNVGFINKNSQSFLQELHDFIMNNFGFGDFVFKYPDGKEVGRAKDLYEMEKIIKTIPKESLEYHINRNHFSAWLMARTEFELAAELRPKKISDFNNLDEAIDDVVDSFRRLRESYQHGIIADFQRARFDPENSFVKLGNGSLGGKGRGIAFMNALLNQAELHKKYKDIEIKVPLTTVLCTEIFEQFIDKNNLKEFAIHCKDDNEITERFLQSTLPEKLQADLYAFLQKVKHPIAVRSSSLLEDSQFLPFAGLYNTYMLPNNDPDIKIRLKQMSDAIKFVYASNYFQSPKAYAKNTNCRIEEQKMAVVIQQLAGERYGDIFYPVISGVAQSYNFYPFDRMNSEDGIAHTALGLGKIVVDGGKVYSFSPAYPRIPPPYLSPKEFLKKSQTYFYALNLANSSAEIRKDEKSTLEKLELERAEKDDTLFFVGSTYCVENQVIRDTISTPGPRIITFANILKYEIFPLAEILKDLLKLGQTGFATPVEIEFAVNLYKDNLRKPEFFFLQIRPLVAGQENNDVLLDDIKKEEIFCMTEHAMGNGTFEDIYDIIYVDPDKFDISQSRVIAREIGKINEEFIKEGRNYILIGYGRWGTSDPWLGVPVEWAQISQAKVIIETNIGDFNVDPSQGSHFFHNITSLRLGYFFIPRQSNEEFIRWEWLKEQCIWKKTEYLIHLRFSKSLGIKIDGKKSKGIIQKPSFSSENISPSFNKLFSQMPSMEIDTGYFR